MAKPFSSLQSSIARSVVEPNNKTNKAEETRNSLHFFDLPLEVRYRIFGHLLDTKLVRFWSRSQYFPSPSDETYTLLRSPWNLSTSILLGSRRLYQEAADFFYKTNLFIRVSILSNFTEHAQILLLEIASAVHFIGAKLARIEQCTQHAADVNILVHSGAPVRAQFIIPHTSLDGLVSFISNLCNGTKADQLPLSGIDIKVRNSYSLAPNVIAESILEPFRKVFNIPHVMIDWQSGPKDYTQSLEADISRLAFDAEAWLQGAKNLYDNGMRAFENGMLETAIQFFGQAIARIETAYKDGSGSRRADMIAMGNEFSKKVNRIRFDSELGVSMAWVNLEDCFERARQAAMNAYSISCNTNVENLNGAVPNDEAWFLDSDRAAALFCDGSAAMALGKFQEARDQFAQAQHLSPYDAGITRAMDQAQRRLDE